MDNLLEIVNSVAIDKKKDLETVLVKKRKPYIKLNDDFEKERYLIDNFKDLIKGNIWSGTI